MKLKIEIEDLSFNKTIYHIQTRLEHSEEEIHDPAIDYVNESLARQIDRYVRLTDIIKNSVNSFYISDSMPSSDDTSLKEV